MILSNLQIEGEISNFNRHKSGHLYFSLKDNKSLIKCVMFKGDAVNSPSTLSEGQKVIAQGYVSIYEKSGEYQLYVKKIKDDGLGELYEAYEKLKTKLEKEGLFHNKYKKDLPFLPKKIGIVTSPTGAAVHDIINIIKRRFPPCDIKIYPSLVQGANASKEIIKALKYLDKVEDIEVIILARGGGSMEDLFCFNDEALARCLFNLKTPLVAAIGHETDFTISEFVADLRAPTPSAAAELVVPDSFYLKDSLSKEYSNLKNEYKKHLDYKYKEMSIFKKDLKYNNPYFKLRNDKQELNMLYKDLVSLMDNKMNIRSKMLIKLENDLKLLNPILALESGHGILLNTKGHIIKSIDQINENEEIDIRLKDGKVKVLVKEISKGE